MKLIVFEVLTPTKPSGYVKDPVAFRPDQILRVTNSDTQPGPFSPSSTLYTPQGDFHVLGDMNSAVASINAAL